MYLTDGCWFLISCVIQHYAPVVGWGGKEQVHNVDYDPGDKHWVCLSWGSNLGRLSHRLALYLKSYLDSLCCEYWVLVSWPPERGQTLSLPPPGMEPGSPTSQAGTLPKELSKQLILWVVGASHLTAKEGSNIKFASAGDQTRVACVTAY
jgi:hypothetical protein